MKNTFSRGDFEFQSENDPIFSTNDQAEIVGSNPTLSATFLIGNGPVVLPKSA